MHGGTYRLADADGGGGDDVVLVEPVVWVCCAGKVVRGAIAYA